jgi:mRNA interferase MazF
MNGIQKMMRKTSVIYKTFDVVVVPFPFTDSNQTKRRPALVVSSHDTFNGEVEQSVLVMITSARNKSWPLDVVIKDLKSTGLPKSSTIRMKFFTLDHRMIIKKAGHLASSDQLQFKKMFSKLFQDL